MKERIMPFIFKHSINSVVRSPIKSILFIFLLTAALLCVIVGTSMLDSANRMLDQADERFSTVVGLKYGGLQNVDGAWADATFQNLIKELDLAQLSNHPAVLAVNMQRDIFAFAKNADEIKQQASPVKDISVFTFRLLYEDETDGWIAVSEHELFGDNIGDQILVKLSPLSTDGKTVIDGLELDRLYIGAAKIGYYKNSRTATFINPVHLISSHQEETISFQEIADITDQDNYFDTTEGQVWQSLINSMRVIDRSFSVTVSSYLPAINVFHLNQTWLIDGQFESYSVPQTSGQSICYISDRVASLLNLGVGDELFFQFHYDYNGNPIFSYWDEEGFVYENDITIAGIFKEAQGLAFNVYMPFQDWVNKKPDDYTFIRFLLKNDEIDSYLDYLDQTLPMVIDIVVEDQGYALAVEPIHTLREYAINLTLISAIAGISVTTLFAYLFIIRQSETARFMMMLGTGRKWTGAYLLFGVLSIALLAVLLAVSLSTLMDLRIAEVVWNSLLEEPALDMRYSERSLGIQSEFLPELSVDPWIRWVCCGVVILIIILLTIGSVLFTLRKPKRRKVRIADGPSISAEKAVSFSWVPFISLRFAFRAVRRNLLRSLIVPIATSLLAVLILYIGYVSAQQQEDAAIVYNEVPVTAYITTFLGESRSVPLHLQSDIFLLLNSEYQSKSIWQMHTQGMKGEDLVNLRSSLETNNPYIKEVLLTSKMHYSLMGVVTSTSGQAEDVDLLRRPEIQIHTQIYGNDWFMAEVEKMPVILFTDSLTSALDYSAAQDVYWLDGYNDYSFRLNDYIVVLPDQLLEEESIQLGDTVRIACYRNVDDTGVLMEAYDFLVVGSYVQGSLAPVIYTPWSLLCYIPISFDYYYLYLDSVEESPPIEWRTSNEYLADSVESATIIPANPQDLSSFRDYLEYRQYSQVGIINRNRLAVVINDRALTNAVESLHQHIYFLNLTKPIMIAISAIIGFLLSYLLTRNRLHEFAIMRSLGTRRFHVYLAFFLEQFFLFLFGILPILIALCFGKGWVCFIDWNLLWFMISYTLGIATAVFLMGRFKVLDILFSRD